MKQENKNFLSCLTRGLNSVSRAPPTQSASSFPSFSSSFFLPSPECPCPSGRHHIVPIPFVSTSKEKREPRSAVRDYMACFPRAFENFNFKCLLKDLQMPESRQMTQGRQDSGQRKRR